MKINLRSIKYILALVITIIIVLGFYLAVKQKGKADVSAGMTLSGLVTNLDGRPVKSALILFLQRDTIIKHVFSDTTGKYRITLLVGYYNLQVVTHDGLVDIENPLQVTQEDYNTTIEYNIEAIPDDNIWDNSST